MYVSKAEEQLQNALVTNYLANLAFLSECDKNLYIRVEELSKLIDSGAYKEKYSLEFIEKNGDFDIYDHKNRRYMYNKKPKKYNKELIKSVNFDEKNIINSLEQALYHKGKSPIYDGFEPLVKEKFQDTIQATSLLRHEVLKYVDIFEEKEKNFKEIEKFIFFGTMLGRHINPIAEKIDADSYFVCEKNLEVFRLSLFVNDYKNLAKKDGVIFSIMEDKEVLDRKLHLFLEFKPFSNYALKLSSTGLNIEEYINAFLRKLVSRKPTIFDYNRTLYTVVKNVAKKVNNYKILDIQTIQEKTPFSYLPVLFVAGGPSFQENIEWIKKNQKFFFIVTVGSIYQTLVKNDIEVNMIISVEGNFSYLDKLQFPKDNKYFPKNSIILCSTMTDERILKRFNKDKLFLFETGEVLIAKEKLLPSFSVGDKSIDLLLSMNVKELYLLGLDLALNQDTGDTHSHGSNSGKENYDFNDNSQNRKTFGLRTGLLKVKGNFHKKVYTTSLFDISIKDANKIIAFRKKQDTKIYNLSSHGAFLEGTFPTEIKNIDLNNFKDIKVNNERFLKFINELTLRNFSAKKEKIKDEIEYIKNDVFKEFYYSKDVKVETYKEFFNSISKFITKTAFKNPKTTILPIFSRNYFETILSFLAYKFNDKDIKNEKTKINKAKDIFYKQFEVLLKDYCEYLEKIVA